MLFLLVSVVGGLTRGASAPQKPVRVQLKPGYALGEETRTEAGPRQQQDRPPPRSRPATTPGSTASSPVRQLRRSGGHTPAPAPCTADEPAQAGQQTDHHGPPAPRHRQRPPRSTAAPRTRRHHPRRPGRPQAPPRAAYYYIHPSQPTARHSARQRTTLYSWTANKQDIESIYM